MNCRPRIFATAIWLLLFAGSLPAADGVQQLRDFMRSVDGLTARFEQTLSSGDRLQTMRSSGILMLRRPNLFRWDYLEPERQQIIADGRQVWLYDQELEQVSVQTQDKALQGTPAMLLTSGETLEHYFELREAGQRDGMQWVQLTPLTDDGQFSRIMLAFRDRELRVMEMADKFGQITRLDFQDIDHNPELEDSLFRFERPDNVDLYNQ